MARRSRRKKFTQTRRGCQNRTDDLLLSRSQKKHSFSGNKVTQLCLLIRSPIRKIIGRGLLLLRETPRVIPAVARD